MTDTKTAASGKRFRRGLALYTLILMMLILAGLVLFYFYISAYEYTRPESSLQRYIDALDEEESLARVQEFVSTLQHSAQPAEESAAFLQEALSDVSYAKKVSECTEDTLVYMLKSGDVVFGKVTLTAAEEKRFGFVPWEVSGEELNLEAFCRETEVTVPSGYRVLCGGDPLGPDDIKEENVHYELLEEFYGDYDMPTMLTYSSGVTLGEVEMQVFDGEDRELRPEELTEDYFTDNCTPEEKAEIEDFARVYIERYVTYLSGANQAHTPNLYAVVALTVRDSDLYSRLYQALGGMGFASSRGDYIQSITVNHTMRLGNDRYLLDATYLVDTYGQHGAETTTTNNAKILLLRTGDGLRAFAQSNY